MKRYMISVAAFFAALLCVFASGVKLTTVSEEAKADYGSCEEHTYTKDYIVVLENTCKKEGLMYRTCDVCGFNETVKTPKDPEKHVNIASDLYYDPKPTCISAGVGFRYCADCGAIAERMELPADPDAHVKSGPRVTVVKPTCLTKGTEAYKCICCDEYFDEKELDIEPDNHLTYDWSVRKTVKAPTCYEEGIEEVYCELCGLKAYTAPIAKTDEHTWEEHRTVDSEPNCTYPGSSSVHCVNCDAVTDVLPIPVVDGYHTYSDEWTIDKVATCTEPGQQSHHCVYCDDKVDIEAIPVDKNAHSFGDEWTVTIEPTCSVTGAKHNVCTLCGEASHDVMIAKLPHTYGEDYEVLDVSADGLSEKVKYVCKVCGHVAIMINVYGSGTEDPENPDDPEKPDTVELKLTSKSVFVIDQEKKIVSNIAREMKTPEFFKNFANGYSFILYRTNGSYANDFDVISTGYSLVYEDVEGTYVKYTMSVTGDVNSDGQITVSDARTVLRAAAGLEKLENEFFAAADVDGSGKITAGDARKTLRVAAGLEFFDSTFENIYG